MRSTKKDGGSTVVVRQSALTGVVATVAVATGLLLDVVMAGVFGAGPRTDAFVAAARVPLALTAVFMVLGNQVLVPTQTAWFATLEQARERRLSTTVLVSGLLGGLVVAGLMALAARPFLLVLAPGFAAWQRDLAASLLVVMVLTIPLTAGSEVLRSWLNARHLFVVPAAMTIVLNVVAAGIILGVRGDVDILPVAFVVGSLVQFLAMLAFACARGFRVTRPALRDPELGTLLRTTGRPTLAAGLNPLARVVETFLASFMPAGSVTILHYGHRLVSAVGGTVFFRSIMIAILPRLTRAYATEDAVAAARLTTLGMRLMLAVSVPLGAMGVVLALPAAQTVFGIGRFSAEDARTLGLVLAIMAVSFVPSAVQRALLTGFYAVRNTQVPLRNTVYGVVANVVLLPAFTLPLWGSDAVVLGAAGAYTLAQTMNVVHAWGRLRASDLHRPADLGRPILRTGVAGLLAGLGALGVMRGSELVLVGDPARAVDLAVILLAGAVGATLAAAVEITGQRPRRGMRINDDSSTIVGTRDGLSRESMGGYRS